MLKIIQTSLTLHFLVSFFIYRSYSWHYFFGPLSGYISLPKHAKIDLMKVYTRIYASLDVTSLKMKKT